MRIGTLAGLRAFGARYIDHKTAWKAALVLGGVIWLINLPHGALAALPAAAKQSAYTFFVAGFIVRWCETLALRFDRKLVAISLATLLPSSVAIGLTYLVHSLKGTPEPLFSTIPTMILAPPSFLVWSLRSRKARA